MSVQTADYVDAAAHLPRGARLTFYDATWDEYEQLLADLGERAHLRVSYNEGRMEIMSPSAKHEQYKNWLHDLVMILSDELEQEILSFGSTTLKLSARARGAEGDDCFYIRRADVMAGKDRLDLTRDPPPDLVIEVDLTSESTDKFAIYAALGVPEIWHYDGSLWRMLRLHGESYEPVPHSFAFPFLPVEQLADYTARSERESSYKARRAFREWARDNKPSVP